MMTSRDIKGIGTLLLDKLSVFFSDRAYSIVCGPHWKDYKKKPDQVAEESIHVKLVQAERPIEGGQIVNLWYEVHSRQPGFVQAGFNLSRKQDLVGKRASISLFLLEQFRVGKLVNSGVEFFPVPHLWFVIYDKGTNLYYHIHLYPKFGHQY